jgi:hypothetical protein
MSTTGSDSFLRLSRPQNVVLAPKRSFLTPNLASSRLKKPIKWVNLTFTARFRWNLIDRLKETCWVRKTQNRKSSANFKDGRRRHLENHWNALNRPFIARFRWNLIDRLKIKCWVRKTQNRTCGAIFKDGRRRHLQNQWNALNRPFIARFRWNLVHLLRETCWVQKTQNQKCSAIFHEGHRRNFEKHCMAVRRPLMTRLCWNLVHVLIKHAEFKKRKTGRSAPLSKLAAAAILKINASLWDSHLWPDFDEIWYTY